MIPRTAPIFPIDSKGKPVYTEYQARQIAENAARMAVQEVMEQLTAILHATNLENGIAQAHDISQESPKMTLTVKEMADMLEISEPTARKLTREEGFPVLKIGKAVRINRRGLEEWLYQQTAQGRVIV